MIRVILLAMAGVAAAWVAIVLGIVLMTAACDVAQWVLS